MTSFMLFISMLCLFVGAHAQDFTTKAISYSDASGAKLKGKLYTPNSAIGKLPVIMHFPDVGGMGISNQKRAQRSVQMGYIGFLGQLFDETEETNATAMPPTLSTPVVLAKYESNLTLFAIRIDAAVRVVKMQANVDADKIVMTGYCFGGTAVTAYATLGNADTMNIKGTWAFHGRVAGFAGSINGKSNDVMLAGVSSWTDKSKFKFSPKCRMVTTAGSADTLMAEADMETFIEAAEQANANWAYQLYGHAHHSFTAPGTFQMSSSGGKIKTASDSPSYKYDVVAKDKSMSTMDKWLTDTLNFQKSPTGFKVKEMEKVSYKDGCDDMEGYVAYPEGMKTLKAVIVAHAGSGVDTAIKEWVKKAAMAGYWAMGAGVFMKGEQGTPQVFQKYYGNNMTYFSSRMTAAVNYAKTQSAIVDVSRIGVAGFCLGGTQVLQYAKSGQADKDCVQAVVSFHGALDSIANPQFTSMGIKYSVVDDALPASNYAKTRVTVINGYKDATIPATDIDKIQKQLSDSNNFWDSVLYGGQTHAWTLSTTRSPGTKYNQEFSDRAFNSLMATLDGTLDGSKTCATSATKNTCATKKSTTTTTTTSKGEDQTTASDVTRKSYVMALLVAVGLVVH